MKSARIRKLEESLSYTVEVFDKDGKLLERVSRPSHSYTRNWNYIINEYASGGQGPALKNTSGASKTPANGAYLWLGSDAGIGVVSKGIRVGRGSTPVAITDYHLETVCGEGTGTNQVRHQAMEWTAPSVAGATCSFTVRRLMVNLSGAAITDVREIGCYFRFWTTVDEQFAMGFRDVLPGNLNVPSGGSIRVTYTLSATV
ncbi:hypothetical protein ES703_51165 [subsurface metagenome]